MSYVADARESSSPAPRASRARSPRASSIATRVSRSGRSLHAHSRHIAARRSTRTTASAPCSRSSISTATRDVDAAIVAYPHGAAAPVVAGLRERGVKVVDLSADFRLRDRATYESWYVPHGAPQLIGDGVYGLTELDREQIAGAELVANPGCFPTGRCSRSRRSRAPG